MSVLRHLHFFWMMLWTTVFAIPCAFAQITNHLLDPTARSFRRWGGLWSRCTLALAGIRVRVSQTVPITQVQPCVLVSNHQSGLDIWVHLVGLPIPFGFVAKAELRKVPFIGAALKYSASLFVDRSTARKAVASMKEAAQRIRAGNSVLIYPEGQRTWSRNLEPFLKGAFQLAVEAGVPIIPTAIRNACDLYDERKKTSSPGTVDLIIGRPIPTDGLTRADIPRLIEQTESFIRTSINAAD